MPHQDCRAWQYCKGGICRSARVHSAAWIFTISAALISRAFWNSHSPSLSGIFEPQPVDDRVVLAGEQGVHAPRGRPTSCRSPARTPGSGAGGLRVGVQRQQPPLVEPEFSAHRSSSYAAIRRVAMPGRVAAGAVLRLEVGAVDLRAVPPMGELVAVGRRPARAAGPVIGSGRVRRMVISGFVPIVARRDRKAVRWSPSR